MRGDAYVADSVVLTDERRTEIRKSLREFFDRRGLRAVLLEDLLLFDFKEYLPRIADQLKIPREEVLAFGRNFDARIDEASVLDTYLGDPATLPR